MTPLSALYASMGTWRLKSQSPESVLENLRRLGWAVARIDTFCPNCQNTGWRPLYGHDRDLGVERCSCGHEKTAEANPSGLSGIPGQ